MRPPHAPPSYALQRRADELAAEFEVEEVATGPGASGAAVLVEPGASAPVVLERFRRGEPDAPPSRSLRPLRWGLVPAWAPDPSGGPRAACAPAATLLGERATAQAALARRCLVPVDAWHGPGDGP
ncbi:SOS response-associated peptidase family protein, partial [Kineococcus indalonis]|uniref:SOS response-associated peptidase family protein n=1 Tax=Kineococcus indalonis TaxID=2696566 RepID=UPI001411F647